MQGETIAYLNKQLTSIKKYISKKMHLIETAFSIKCIIVFVFSKYFNY